MSDLVRRRVSVSGRVQGVGFRYFVRSTAGRVGVSGFVRNMPDGTVQAEVQGNPEGVDRFLDAIREGPPGARVDQVDVNEVPAEKEKEGFEIRFS